MSDPILNVIRDISREYFDSYLTDDERSKYISFEDYFSSFEQDWNDNSEFTVTTNLYK